MTWSRTRNSSFTDCLPRHVLGLIIWSYVIHILQFRKALYKNWWFCWVFGLKDFIYCIKIFSLGYRPCPVVSLLSWIFLYSVLCFLILSLHCSRVREKPNSRKPSAIFRYTKLFLQQPSSCSWITSSFQRLINLNVASQLQLTIAI